MKAIKNIFLVLGILVTVSGCDYLDSEPEERNFGRGFCQRKFGKEFFVRLLFFYARVE